MGSYKQYITNAGEKLIVRALGGSELRFTRVVTSSAEITGTGDQIKEIVDLTDVKQTVAPGAATAMDNVIRVLSVFSNEDITNEYIVQSVGLYAQIGDEPEVLFDIAVAVDPSKMTDATSLSVNRLEFNFNISVQQAEKITITVAPGSYLPSEVFYNTIYKMLDKSLLQQAFYDTFTYLERSEAQAMSSEDILQAINTEWGGESSDDPNALSAADVAAALSSDYNGETSSDPNALSAAQINEILTAPGGAQLTAAEITALLS